MSSGTSSHWALRPSFLATLAAALFLLFMGGTFHGGMQAWQVSLGTHVLIVWGCLWVSRRLPGRLADDPDEPTWHRWLFPFPGGPFLYRQDRRMLWVGAILALYVVFRALGTPLPRFGLPAAVGALAGFALVLGVPMALKSSSQGRLRALEVFALLGALVAAWSLWRWSQQITPRAMLPLGHHNLPTISHG